MHEVRDTASTIIGGPKRDQIFICRTTPLYTKHPHTDEQTRISTAELEACKQS
jgi:hypothetical protein